MNASPVVAVLAVVAAVAAILWLALRNAGPRPKVGAKAIETKQPSSKAALRATAMPRPSTKGAEDVPAAKRGDSRPVAADADDALESGPRTRDVEGLRRGLTKMRESGGFFGRLKELFVGKKELDPQSVEAIEEILLTSDVGSKTTEQLLESVRETLAKKELANSKKVWATLRTRAKELLDVPGGGAIRDHGCPTVVLMVGVNGAGKTTTIGKLATTFSKQGKKVLIVAGDTFRAAAVQQLQAWGTRVGCDVFTSKEGADPASVVFDAVTHAMAEKHDLVLCDTAGRLHTKSNLMDELRKVHRTAQKVLTGAPHEVLLVVDGTTGQNAIQQAAEFGATLPLTGIVLTKLDGTAKGGVVLAIANEQRLPVRYIGVGESAQDLRVFDAGDFIEALLGGADEASDTP